jgi:hypothetical protein
MPVRVAMLRLSVLVRTTSMSESVPGMYLDAPVNGTISWCIFLGQFISRKPNVWHHIETAETPKAMISCILELDWTSFITFHLKPTNVT